LNLPFFIARRYFLSKRKKNFINIISILSMVGIAFSTAALIIVLSVFNGLEDLLHTLNKSFDPELKIEPVKGKSFLVSPSFLKKIKAVPGVEIVTEVIEDFGYVRYRDAAIVATIKGVSDNYIDQHRIDSSIVEGEVKLKAKGTNFAIIGRGVADVLSIAVEDDMHALQIFYIKNVSASTIDPSERYSSKSIRPGAVFSIEKTLDDSYIVLPLDFARELLDYGNKRTSLEIKVGQGISPETVQQKLMETLGGSFHVLTDDEQHKDIYKLLKLEKFFVFMAMTLLIIIGSINIFFSLMMLVIDKKKDISVLIAMGADDKFIKSIIVAEGALISSIGAGTGLGLGALICWVQDQYGLVGMGMANAVIPNYPVKLIWTDLAMVCAVMVIITLIISFQPASRAARSYSIADL
jgi:lipoprotein-releasing system permease protein